MKFVIQYQSRGARTITLVKTTRLKIRKDESVREFTKRVLGDGFVTILQGEGGKAALVWNKNDNRKKDGTPYKERPGVWTRWLNLKLKDGWKVVQGEVFPGTQFLVPTPNLEGWK